MMKSNLKKVIALLASLVLLCSLLPMANLLMADATGTNVVLNGDFENGESNWSYGSGSHEISTDAHGGNKALSLTNPGMWASAAEQTVSVSANSEYTITWYSKRVAGSGVFNLYVMNASGYANLESVSGENWMNKNAAAGWVKNEYVVKTGTATAVILKFSTESSNPGTILIDDVTMTRKGGDAPEPDEPIAVGLVNGDFETGDESGWTVYQGTATKADAKHAGSYGLHLTGNGGWGGMAFQNVTVVPGKEYTISMWLKTVGNGVNVQVKDGGTGGANLTSTWFTTKEWTQVTFVVIPTTDTLCLNFCGGGNGVAENVYLDDVTITAPGGEIPDEPESSNMLKNGDFEAGVSVDWENVWGSCTVEEVAGRDSSKAMKVSAGQWNIVRQKVTVEANTDYVITVWYKDANKMGLLIKDGNDSANLKQGDLASGSDWKQATVEFNSGDNTSVYVGVMGNEAGATATFDDFVMTKKGEEPVTPPPSSDSGLVNGNFETGDLTGWDAWQQTEVSASAKKNGSYGATLKGDGGWGGLLDQNFTVEAGKEYTLSFWYKAISGGANFVVKENGSSIASYWGNTKDWTQFTLEFTASTDSLLLNICGGGDGVASEIYVDDFVLTAKGDEPVTPPPSSESGLVNGDFETGDLSGWDVWQQTEISADAKKGGSYGAHLKGNGGWGGLLDQTFSVETGKDYILTFWYKANSSGANFVVKNGGAAVVSHWGNATSWTEVTLEFTAPSDSLLLNICGGGTGVAEDIYLDNVVLTEKPAAPGYPTELINGSFENGDEGWSLNSYASVVSDDAHGGNSALKIENPSAWAEAALQTVAVKPNTNYVINWYAKRVSGTGAFNLILMKESTANYSCDGQNWMNETSGDWTKYEVIITTDELGVVTFKFTSEGANAGVILIDDITLTEEGEEPVDPTGNLIKNGSFENGKDDWNWNAPTDLSKDSYIGEASARLDYDKAYGEALTQVVKVEPGQDYVLIWWTRRISGGGAWDLFLMDYDSINVTNTNIDPTSGNKWFQQTTKDWTESRIEFNSGEASKLFIKFGPESSDAGVFLLDEVGLYVKGTEPTDPIVPPTPPKTSMYMTNFGVLNNRPNSEEANMLINGSFEADGGQWVSGFTGETVSVIDDETTKFGDKSLFFNTAGKEVETKVVFWLDVEANTDYVFSTWLKGEFLAADNRGNATIGVVDVDGNYLTMSSTEDKLTLFLNGERQIVPTAWDNEWHLRGVQFNTGDATKIGIAMSGTNSKLYIDDMALFVVGQGVKYMSDNMKGSVSLSYDIDDVTCKDKDSLIPDPNFDTKDSAGFWADSYGWRNGFLTFADNDYEYGTSLKYTASENNAPLSIIKWIDVEPHTDYTFAVDLKILEDGFGKLVLVDDKHREKQNFVQISFDSYDYNEANSYYGWYTAAQKFNTGVYTRIGISVVDDGGSALLDNMRLYKSDKGDKDVVDAFVVPPEDPEEDYPEYDGDDYIDVPEDPVEPEEPYVEPDEPVEPDTPADEIVEEEEASTLVRILRLLKKYLSQILTAVGLGGLAVAGGGIFVVALLVLGIGGTLALVLAAALILVIVLVKKFKKKKA